MNSRSSDRCGCPFFIPPFSLRSGGSGPRRATFGRLRGIRHAPSIIRGSHDGLPHQSRRRSTTSTCSCIIASRCFRRWASPLDAAAVDAAFRPWLLEMMPKGVYRAWVVEARRARRSSGGGITILPWPPGPRYPGGRLAFVYNVYTEPDHRRRGLARMVMETIHALVSRGRHRLAGAERQPIRAAAVRVAGLRA